MSSQMKLTPEALQIDAGDWCRQIEAFINETFILSHRDGIVVPISGGLDSSVVAALCTRAIGKDKVLGLMLPERLGNPEANRYGQLIADHLDIKRRKINISPILRGLGTANILLSAVSGRGMFKGTINQLLKMTNQSSPKIYMDLLTGNLDSIGRKVNSKAGSKQRARLLVTYKIAEEHNLMVAGASHKTEQMVGLFVKYGIDDAADIMPLKNIYRSQTLQLAAYLDLPAEILNRAPNPDILPGVTNKYQDYLGIDALQVDLILLGLERDMTVNQIAVQLGLDEQTVTKMIEVLQLSEQFRRHALAPVLK